MFQNSDTFNEVLTGYAQGAFQNPGDVLDVAELLFPTVAVKEAAGIFYKYDPAAAFQAINAKMARNGDAPTIEFKKTKDTWECEPYGIETPTFKFATKGELGKNARRKAVEFLSSATWTTRQVEAVTLMQAACPVQDDFGGWLGAAGAEADPIEELRLAIWKVGKGCAVDANTVLFGADAWAEFCAHPKVLARLKNTDTDVNEDDVRKWLKMPQLNICVANTRAKADGEEGYDHLLKNDVVVLYTQEAVTETDMSFGKTFTLMPAGPELISYEEKGVFEKDMFFWAEDKQTTNPNAAVRFVVHTAA